MTLVIVSGAPGTGKSTLADVLAGAGVTAVVEAAFQDSLWRPRLTALAALAPLRVIRCEPPPGVVRARLAARMAADAAHDDAALLARPKPWEPITMDVPTLVVDTAEGYRPSLAAIAEFAFA